MAIIYNDPNTAGPSPLFQDKDVHVRFVQLDQTNFTTTGVNALKLALPADSSIIGVDYWVATALNNGATSPQISLGTSSGGTQFANAAAVTNTVGTIAKLSPLTGIMQAYNPPYTSDIQIWVRGICATANPTAADVRLAIYYIR